MTRVPGYALRIFPEELDISQFEQLVTEGREALTAGAADQAARTLRQALSLWQGPALADFRYEPFAQAEIVRLEELRLTCVEERLEADLALGLASVLVAELQRLVSEHPVRERLRGQLMLALYRDGRQTALRVYREFRSVLRDELGLDPSPQLRKLETAILQHDSWGSSASTATGAPLARRPVTTVCVLLRAASDSGAALDPEAYEAVSERSVAYLTAVLERYGGTLANSADERLIGVFGAASLHEDDALRAVRASVEARRVLATELADLARRYGLRLTCRFGVATGEALVGGSVPAGSAGHVGTQAVMLAEAAGPDQILISRPTKELAGAAIETENSGPDRFILQSAQAAVRPLALRLDVPLVGRDEEMRQLLAACGVASHERVTTLVTVIGEAGLGKTRLVYELERRLGQEADVLTGRCLPYGEGITFWPLREVIRQASGGHDSAERIEALLSGETDATAVTERLSLAIGPAKQGRLDGAEIFWAARRLLETLARSRPLLVVFEDLHWAEPTFLDLVESLAVKPGRSPITLVCVARPELLEQRPAWAAGTERAFSIELSPLAQGSSAALLDSLIGDQRIPPPTRARLLETAAGNPLYLEQLAASLGEDAGSESWPVLPPTIQALLGARLQRLGPGASSVLASAAIVLKAAAVTLYKIANDLRWLGSGPRTGIEELVFPANEPGSSIMPGKVNPTQAEAMLMVAIQVIASDVAVTMGGAEGNFELNAFRPILISNYLHSALIMADMCDHLRKFMIEGTKLNEAKLKENIDNSVMMVTALSPVIGYDKSAAISYYAIDHDATLKQAALANGVSEDLYDKVVNPLALTRGGSADVPSGGKRG